MAITLTRINAWISSEESSIVVWNLLLLKTEISRYKGLAVSECVVIHGLQMPFGQRAFVAI